MTHIAQPRRVLFRPKRGRLRLVEMNIRRTRVPTPAKPEVRGGVVVADRYRIDGVLGEGKMGRVFEAIELETLNRVALKVSYLGSGDEPFQRFLREVEITRSVRHPNVVRILDAGRTDDQHGFITLELLEGRTLQEALHDGEDVPKELLLQQLLDALVACHDVGVVHRDITPKNIFMTVRFGRMAAVLIDFGLGKPVGGSRMTDPDDLLGVPTYLTPEQVLGEDVDARADIYGFGVVAHELLSGTRLFQAEETHAVLQKVLEEVPPRLDTVAPGVSSALADLVARCLEKAASARFADSRELREAWRAATAAN